MRHSASSETLDLLPFFQLSTLSLNWGVKIWSGILSGHVPGQAPQHHDSSGRGQISPHQQQDHILFEMLPFETEHSSTQKLEL